LDGNLVEHGICLHREEGKWRFSQGDYWSVYESLLKKEGEASRIAQKGFRIWERCIAHGDLSGFQEWLQAGGNLQETNEKQQTPLLLAVERGELRIIELMLENGGPPETLLAAAVEEHKWEVLKFVIGWAKMRARPVKIDAETFLWTLNDCADAEVVRALLDAGADLDAELHGHNALFHATLALADPTIVKLLLERGAKLQQADSTESALANAIQKEQIEAVKLLLSAGADLFKTPPFTKTVQYAAIERLIEAEQREIDRCQASIQTWRREPDAASKIREAERAIKLSTAVIARHNETLEWLRPKAPAFYLDRVRDEFKAEVLAFEKSLPAGQADDF
jgi:hypothetical protein